MKKNGEYVGVDEKYIPEDEKYVDNTINSEIQDGIHKGIQSAKEYIADEENQEKIKNTGKKGLKILKGIGIGYLVFFGIVILMIILVFILVFSNFFKISSDADKMKNDFNNITNQSDNIISEFEKSAFNNPFELYVGTNSSFQLNNLLDKIVTSNKKEINHPITVIYGETITATPNEIITLKKQFDTNSNYEVMFDYDEQKMIHQVTITNN